MALYRNAMWRAAPSDAHNKLKLHAESCPSDQTKICVTELGKTATRWGVKSHTFSRRRSTSFSTDPSIHGHLQPVMLETAHPYCTLVG